MDNAGHEAWFGPGLVTWIVFFCTDLFPNLFPPNSPIVDRC